MSYGITEQAATISNLIAGFVKTKAVPCVASLGALAVGDVLEWDGTNHAFKKYTSGYAAHLYAVVQVATTIGADGGDCVAIVEGEVNKDALAATPKADADIYAALASSGIFLRSVLAA